MPDLPLMLAAQQGLSYRDMQSLEEKATHPPHKVRTWVHSLAKVIKRTEDTTESRLPTVLACDIKSSKPALFVPPDMTELQPRALRYLHAFAQMNEFRLVEDRRKVEMLPAFDQRDRKPPMIAMALSELLKQTGMPGMPRTLSDPHRLNPDSPHIGLSKLIDMAAVSADKAKRIVLLPNRMMINVLDNDTQPISGYGCRLTTTDTKTVLSHFDSPTFRAIGYSSGSQYIMHVCLAGGPLSNPALWAHIHTLTRMDFRFQLYPAAKAANDFGLLYATFYMDLSHFPAPWWLKKSEKTIHAVGHSALDIFDEHAFDHRKAS